MLDSFLRVVRSQLAWVVSAVSMCVLSQSGVSRDTRSCSISRCTGSGATAIFLPHRAASQHYLIPGLNCSDSAMSLALVWLLCGTGVGRSGSGVGRCVLLRVAGALQASCNPYILWS